MRSLTFYELKERMPGHEDTILIQRIGYDGSGFLYGVDPRYADVEYSWIEYENGVETGTIISYEDSLDPPHEDGLTYKLSICLCIAHGIGYTVDPEDPRTDIIWADVDQITKFVEVTQ